MITDMELILIAIVMVAAVWILFKILKLSMKTLLFVFIALTVGSAYIYFIG